jgi:hypothetical protein
VDCIVDSDPVDHSTNALDVSLQRAEKIEAPDRVALATDNFYLCSDPDEGGIRQTPTRHIHFCIQKFQRVRSRRTRRSRNAGPSHTKN